MIHAAGLMLLCRATGRLLFVKRGAGSDFAGCWHAPGGRTEPGETPEQTAEREAREEAGANPHGNPVLWTHQVNDDPTDYEQPVSYTTFLADVNAEFVPTLNWENTAWAWAPANDPPLPLHPGCEEALRKLTGETIPEEQAVFAEKLAWNREHSAKIDAALAATGELMKRADSLLAPK
jgi:8-oxo-dGTP pyrophosphatase MutT (NUDIX family)